MAIHIPGKRARNGHIKSAKRSAVAVLQLTAMVDMFTVLTVFLLQNFATTNQVLPIDQSVQLPSAHEVKELQPSNVVVLSAKEGLSLNNQKIAEFRTVKEQQDWMIQPLAQGINRLIQDGEAKKASLGNKIRQAVTEARQGAEPPDTEDDFRKLTIQADKTIDFLTVKKVMYTVTEAGIHEINFAVIKKQGSVASN